MKFREQCKDHAKRTNTSCSNAKSLFGTSGGKHIYHWDLNGGS